MDEHSEMREKLKAELAEIVERDEEVRRAMRRKDPAGNLSFEDLGVESEFDDVFDSLGDRSRTELLDVWNAIQRMDRGTYGTCSQCGRKISVERLQALPATEYCIECASQLEGRDRKVL